MDQVVRPAHSPDSVTVLMEEPQQHYSIIATIEARGETLFDSFDDLRRKLIEEAARIGGDALILGRETTESTLIMTPTGFINSDTRRLAAEVIVFDRRPR